MTTDIHTRVMLENWGFLAEVGEWATLEKAVDLYLEQNPPLIYPEESSAAGIANAPALPSDSNPKEKGLSFDYGTNNTKSRLSAVTRIHPDHHD